MEEEKEMQRGGKEERRKRGCRLKENKKEMRGVQMRDVHEERDQRKKYEKK